MKIYRDGDKDGKMLRKKPEKTKGDETGLTIANVRTNA